MNNYQTWFTDYCMHMYKGVNIKVKISVKQNSEVNP